MRIYKDSFEKLLKTFQGYQVSGMGYTNDGTETPISMDIDNTDIPVALNGMDNFDIQDVRHIEGRKVLHEIKSSR